MSDAASILRALLGSSDPAQVVQGVELLAAAGDPSLYVETLAEWAWRWDRDLTWTGEGEAPFPAELATRLWLDAPPDAPWPRALGPERARKVRVTWPDHLPAMPKLQAMPRLRSLSLTREKGDLRERPLTGLPAQLRHLDVRNTGGSALPTGVEELTGLRRLVLRTMSTEGDKLPRVSSLELRSCWGEPDLSLSEGSLRRLVVTDPMEPVLYTLAKPGLSGLRSLTLRERENPIDLPFDLGALPHLRELILEQNDLWRMPGDLSALTQLRRLELGRNDVRDLPGWMSTFQDLRLLSLWGNPLRELPAVLAKLPNLAELDVSGTYLEKLPDWLPQLAGLEALDLAATEDLAELPVDLLLALPRLSRLRVSEDKKAAADALVERAWREQGRRIELCAGTPLRRGGLRANQERDLRY